MHTQKGSLKQTSENLTTIHYKLFNSLDESIIELEYKKQDMKKNKVLPCLDLTVITQIITGLFNSKYRNAITELK